MTRREWDEKKKRLLFKVRREALGNFALLFVDEDNNCILHEYEAPLRQWQRWELQVVYGVFRMQLKELIE
jgi:hypothetical protein